MDHKTTTNPESDAVWLTDKDGNTYLVHREVIEHSRVPEDIKSEVQNFIEADTQGYGEGNFLVQGVLDHMGLKAGMKGFDGTFDLDGDGDTDWDDYAKAKKIWYEQYGKNVPSPTDT